MKNHVNSPLHPPPDASVRRATWAYDLLNTLGIPVQILPELIDAGSFVGVLQKSVQDELGVGEIPVIAAASHDTASAVIAAPISGNDEAYISSGTWSLLGIECEKPVISETTLNHNYTNEGGFNRTVRLLKNIMGLWVYQECRRAWQKEGYSLSYDKMDALAGEAKPFQAFIDVDDEPFYSPGNMPAKVIDYCGRTNQQIPEDMGSIIRIVIESLALKYRSSVEELEKIINKDISFCVLSAGMQKQNFVPIYRECLKPPGYGRSCGSYRNWKYNIPVIGLKGA